MEFAISNLIKRREEERDRDKEEQSLQYQNGQMSLAIK